MGPSLRFRSFTYLYGDKLTGGNTSERVHFVARFHRLLQADAPIPGLGLAAKPAAAGEPSWFLGKGFGDGTQNIMVYENFYANKKTPKTYSSSFEASFLDSISFAPLPTNTSFWAIVAVASETDAYGDRFAAGSVLDTSEGVGSVAYPLDKAPDAKLASVGAYLLSKYRSYAKVPQVSSTFVGSGGEDWVLETVPVTLGGISLILIVGVPATGV
ncbi:hypothetical protein BDK51DRAFT_34596 [Blyttiomyces helicus]|uniref:Uncharacterized protein n=1 Tax=Blyttiomyces helicus TaxID=388810 RepID=A0A4V1ISU1_9FUNG|nr:hypothetical protein BDK51DRAFT_34596 [Blyttiomyces helicus]|eukprot:RKO94737.1 hypothetical protein BDK51DRAFT_34596 [Blyttiomyces helicus]